MSGVLPVRGIPGHVSAEYNCIPGLDVEFLLILACPNPSFSVSPILDSIVGFGEMSPLIDEDDTSCVFKLEEISSEFSVISPVLNASDISSSVISSSSR